MQIKSSNNSEEKTFSKPLKIKKENIICKDGFCTLPNQIENPSISKNNINLFDPIWPEEIKIWINEDKSILLIKKVECLKS